MFGAATSFVSGWVLAPIDASTSLYAACVSKSGLLGSLYAICCVSLFVGFTIVPGVIVISIVVTASFLFCGIWAVAEGN